MQRFEKLMALAAPLDEKNIDTDQLVPARFLMKSRADGYAQYLFYDRRPIATACSRGSTTSI